MNKHKFLKFGALLLAISTVLPTSACTIVISPDGPSVELNTPDKKDDVDKETGYFKMLMNVLNDEHYNSLIESAKSNPDLFESAEFDPHPYAFLEDEGYDISKIKDGTSECFTMSYVLDDEPNNLYIHTRLLVDDSYYASYLLKYELTKQEMKDYQLMHGDAWEGCTYYVHSVFLNNEVAEMKKPKIVTECMYKKEFYQYMKKNFEHDNQEELSNRSCYVVLFAPNTDEQTFKVVLLPTISSYTQMKYDTHCLEVDYRSLTPVKFGFENGILSGHYPGAGLEEVTSSQTLNGNFYIGQHAELINRQLIINNEK